MIRVLASTLTLLHFISCAPDQVQLKKLDLSGHGLPIVIKAPENSEVIRKEYEEITDVMVRSGDDFHLQIFITKATAASPDPLKAEELEALWQEQDFLGLVREDKNGFIFRKKPATKEEAYDFRLIRIEEGLEFIFRTDIVDDYSLEAVELMYKACR